MALQFDPSIFHISASQEDELDEFEGGWTSDAERPMLDETPSQLIPPAAYQQNDMQSRSQQEWSQQRSQANQASAPGVSSFMEDQEAPVIEDEDEDGEEEPGREQERGRVGFGALPQFGSDPASMHSPTTEEFTPNRTVQAPKSAATSRRAAEVKDEWEQGATASGPGGGGTQATEPAGGAVAAAPDSISDGAAGVRGGGGSDRDDGDEVDMTQATQLVGGNARSSAQEPGAKPISSWRRVFSPGRAGGSGSDGSAGAMQSGLSPGGAPGERVAVPPAAAGTPPRAPSGPEAAVSASPAADGTPPASSRHMLRNIASKVSGTMHGIFSSLRPAAPSDHRPEDTGDGALPAPAWTPPRAASDLAAAARPGPSAPLPPSPAATTAEEEGGAGRTDGRVADAVGARGGEMSPMDIVRMSRARRLAKKNKKKAEGQGAAAGGSGGCEADHISLLKLTGINLPPKRRRTVK